MYYTFQDRGVRYRYLSLGFLLLPYPRHRQIRYDTIPPRTRQPTTSSPSRLSPRQPPFPSQLYYHSHSIYLLIATVVLLLLATTSASLLIYPLLRLASNLHLQIFPASAALLNHQKHLKIDRLPSAVWLDESLPVKVVGVPDSQPPTYARR